jgi:hypothetical protein
MRAVLVLLLLALASADPNLLLAVKPPKRTLIRSVPAGNVYSYENAAGETVEELENRQGKLVSRHFYRPAPPACAYLHNVGLGTGRCWRDDDERVFHCLSPMTQRRHAAERAQRLLEALDGLGCLLGGAVGLFIVQVDRYAYPSLEIAPRYL